MELEPESSSRQQQPRNVDVSSLFIRQRQLQMQMDQLSLRSSQQSPKVKLPPFWEADAAAWFDLADEVFEALQVTDSRSKYRAVLVHIPPHILERARGVLRTATTSAQPFEQLKAKLVELLTPSELELVQKIINGPELGGQRPSDMMDAMLAALPPGEAAGRIFKGLWLRRLPADLSDQVAPQFSKLDPQQLATYADTIWDARNAKKASVVASTVAPGETASQGEMDPLQEAIAALNINLKKWNKNKGRGGYKGKGRGGGRGGGNGGQQGHKGGHLCSRHREFGDNAYKCEEPGTCTWSGN